MAGFLLAAAVTALGLVPAAAQAAPRRPTAIQIAGPGLPGGKVVIQAKDKPQLFSTVLSEVSWLATATPQTSAPQTRKLGPKYTVTVLARSSAQQVYDLYPSAVGGPRAHRPSKQPTGKKADGWFFGRLTMSESLRLAGVPLTAKTDVITGGIGGGAPTDVVSDVAPPPTVNEMLAQLRQLFLLNGAVLIVIVAGMGGIAYLIRRKV